MEFYRLSEILDSAVLKVKELAESKIGEVVSHENLQSFVVEGNSILEEYNLELRSSLGVELYLDAKYSDNIPKDIICIPIVRRVVCEASYGEG